MTLVIIFLVLYATPTIVAAVRKHRQAVAICLLNLFLGWTVVGWVCALVWAATTPQQVVVIRERDA